MANPPDSGTDWSVLILTVLFAGVVMVGVFLVATMFAFAWGMKGLVALVVLAAVGAIVAARFLRGR